METLFQNLPEIIRASASSELGIASLLILVISAIAYVFFRHDGSRIKIIIFSMLLFSSALLIYKVADSTGEIRELEEAGFAQEDLEKASIDILIRRIASDNCINSQLAKVRALQSLHSNNKTLLKLHAVVLEREKAAVNKDSYENERYTVKRFAPECPTNRTNGTRIYAGYMPNEEVAQSSYEAGLQYMAALQYLEAAASFKTSAALWASLPR
jgi:hypothetical protein